jgi:hypothetical protein
MASLLSAQVFVKETDLTTIIPAVSSTEGAIAGQFNWGPVNYPFLVDSENALVQFFNKPDNNNAEDWWSAANFLAYTNKLYVVRVVDETNANTSLRATNATVSNSSGKLVRSDKEYNTLYTGGSLMSTYGTGSFIAKYPGALGNSLKISICSSAQAYQQNLSGTLTVTANSLTVTGSGTNFTSQVKIGDLLVLNNETHKVTAIANTTSMTLETRHIAGASAAAGTRRWEYYGNVDAAPGTSDNIRNLGGSNDEMHVAVVDEDGLWTGQTGTVLEVYQFLSKSKDGKINNGATNYYRDRLNTESKYIRWAGHDAGITGAGGAATATFSATDAVIKYSLVGGNNGGNIGNTERVRGYNYFRNKEEIDISFIIGAAANQTVAVNIINNIVEVREDCVAFFSPPKAYVVNAEGSEADNCVIFRNTLPSTSYATLDGNWKNQYDVYNDVYRYLPCNGDTAGLYARTDNERDAWWAAAGLNRGHMKNVINLAWNPRLAERDILYKNGINPIVSFPGEGPVLWGNKTLQAKPSAFDRMNVRRLFIVLEKAIAKAAQYMLFEFNDVFTRAQFRNMVEPYLRDVQGRRGIYDFLVVCDETNNTPEVIDRNEFKGDIYIKPARVAEFITLNFIATRTGVEFTEIVGRTGV